MQNVKRIGVVLGAVLVLGGCAGGSILESKKIDYKSAGKLPPLEIPPDLTNPGRDERYVVPDFNARGSATYSAYSSERANRPANVNDVLPQVDKMRIERAGTQRWLVVAGTPDKVWPMIKDFWQELGFIINVESPDTGVMETDWAENRAKIPQGAIRNLLGRALDQLYATAERDKFRTRLEPGAEPGTTEIYISHRGVMEVFETEGEDSTVWQPRPADPDLEAEMLRRLMVRLGVEENRAQNMVAQAPAEQRAKLLRGSDGSTALEVQEAFDRAWRRVGLALDRIGFTVEDRDRAGGVYYVRYVDPEADATGKSEKGLLAKLMFWRSDAPQPASAQRYRVRLQGDGDATRVQVLSREGAVDGSETAKKILGLLLDQLK